MIRSFIPVTAFAVCSTLCSVNANAAQSSAKIVAPVENRYGHLVVDNDAMKLRIEARAQFDGAVFDSKENIPMSDGVEVRRARLALKAELGSDWQTELDIEFEDTPDIEIEDLWLKYVALENNEFTIGQKKVNFSIGEVTSSRAINFINRPVPVDIYAPGRRLMLDHVYHNDKFRLNWGVFGDQIDTFNNDEDDAIKDNGIDSSVNFFARANYLPVRHPSAWLVVGASIAAIEPDPVDRAPGPDGEPAENYMKVDSEAGWGVDQNEPLELRSQGIERAYHYGLEAYGNWANFGFQAEYLGGIWQHGSGSFIDEDDRERSYAELDDIKTDGGYVTLMWYPQGIHRTVNMWDAERRYIFVNDGPGLWELLIRAETIDLSDGAGKTGAERARGGEYTGVTFGANYYYSNNVKFMLNLHYADLKDAASDNWKNKDNRRVVDGQRVEGGTDDEVYALMARIQFQF